MLYHIEIPHIIQKDIEELSEYVFRMSLSHNSAQKIYDTLYKHIFSLNFMPYRFEVFFGEYRRIIVDGKYKILYRIDEANKKVIIIRIIRTEMEYIDI